MKATTTLAVFLFATLLSPISLRADKLTINLEGPWILYEDDNFHNGSNIVHVVIAITSLKTIHYPPSFSTGGDGFLIQYPGIYCVAFDGKCDPNSNQSLSTDGFPKSLHLPAKSLQGWKWYAGDPKKDKAIYLIFPMPDSFSNDGDEKMRFGKVFGQYGSPARHSIGTEFHYDSGPTTLNLDQCSFTMGSMINATDCTQPMAASDMTNSGTLRITMKAPEDEKCSYHVRNAYPKMLALLDPTKLDGSDGRDNINQDIAFIDLPDDTPPSSGTCLDCDPQGGPHPENCAPTAMAKQQSLVNIPDEINQILRQFGNLKLDSKEQIALQIQPLQQVAGSLKGHFPQFSQLGHIKEILNLSEQALQKIQKKQSQPSRRGSGKKAIAQRNLPLSSFQNVQSEVQHLNQGITRYFDAGTTGVDCRSVQMLVQ